MCNQMRAHVEKVDVLGWNKSNTKGTIHNINTVMKVLSTKINNKMDVLNGWCQWNSNVQSYNMW